MTDLIYDLLTHMNNKNIDFFTFILLFFTVTNNYYSHVEKAEN